MRLRGKVLGQTTPGGSLGVPGLNDLTGSDVCPVHRQENIALRSRDRVHHDVVENTAHQGAHNLCSHGTLLTSILGEFEVTQ